jgi:DNA-binding winged helix-turn-helix (wHTH) protein
MVILWKRHDATDAQIPVSIRFRGWELRPVERVLNLRGEPAAVGGRAFDVLLALVQGHGKVVTKGALPRRGMPGLVIEENNIQKGGIA